jgi:ectoine hydroxylase-related dioxygenase (phytanoyl-CoA dioxygenase family)
LSDIASLDAEDIKAGLRNADKKLLSITKLAQSALLTQKAEHYLGNPAQLVRAILFDKSPDNNWLVSWHQDRTICVSHQLHIDGWGPWTIKDEVHHVQPPLEVLNQMVTFRIHLDEATPDNGCLRIIPGSHLLGLLNSSHIAEATRARPNVNCIAKAGTMLVMRPHVLHASSKSESNKQRRVIHLEYSSYKLPAGLRWA